VKISDAKLYSRIGVEDSPVVVYYENDVPFLYQVTGASFCFAARGDIRQLMN
jgi:hypothetical protein